MSNYGRNGGGGFDPDNVIDIGKKATEAFRRNIKLVIIVALIGIVAVTTYYQVEPDEVAVVTRFGKFIKIEGPGAHFKIPFWIDKKEIVKVQEQKKEEFGFRTIKAGIQTQYADPAGFIEESTMLTGDLNVATVEWIVQFKVNDPYKYLFRVRDVQDTFRDMAESTMRHIVGDHSVTEVISIGRTKIEVDGRVALQELSDKYETGIEVLQVVLKDVNPPGPVQDAFNDVSRAQQERESAINKAEARYNQVVPEARGKALQVLQAAEGYATARVNRAKGDVAKFIAIQKEYAKAPKVTRIRLYLETMSQVLPQAGKRILLDASMKGLVPLLPLQGGGQ